MNQCVGFSRSLLTTEPLQADSIDCGVTFFVEHVSVTSTILWSGMISINLFLTLHGWNDTKLRTLQPYQHFIVWGYALSSTLPPLIRDKYGPVPIASYCYFSNPLDPRRLLVWIPVAVCCLFGICLVLDAICFFLIRRRSLAGIEMDILKRLAFMVLVFNLLWGMALGSRIYDAFADSDQSNLVGLANTLSGFCNFIVWGITNPRVVSWVYFKIGSAASQSIFAATDEASSMTDTLLTNYTQNSTLQHERTPSSFQKEHSSMPHEHSSIPHEHSSLPREHSSLPSDHSSLVQRETSNLSNIVIVPSAISD